MNSPFNLLYPEWQGFGENTDVYHGAIKIAETLFPTSDFVCVDVPISESLERIDGVLGLHSIVPRFQSTIKMLRTENPDKIFMIGGTCGVEVAPVGYLNEKYKGDLAVVWLDAHGDLNTPSSSPSGHFHGMALRTLLGEGPQGYIEELSRFLNPSQVFLAGTRDLDPSELNYISKVDISVTKPQEFGNPPKLVQQIQDRGFKHLYLHLDLDVLNPKSFPDSLMQTPGGPSVEEVINMIQNFASAFEIVGFSVLEYVERHCGSIEVVKDLVLSGGITIKTTS